MHRRERGRKLKYLWPIFHRVWKRPKNLYGNDRLKMHLYSTEKMHFNFSFLRDLLCSLDLVIVIYHLINSYFSFFTVHSSILCQLRINNFKILFHNLKSYFFYSFFCKNTQGCKSSIPKLWQTKHVLFSSPSKWRLLSKAANAGGHPIKEI